MPATEAYRRRLVPLETDTDFEARRIWINYQPSRARANSMNSGRGFWGLRPSPKDFDGIDEALVQQFAEGRHRTAKTKADGSRRECRKLKLPQEFVLYSLRYTALTRFGQSRTDAFTILRIAGAVVGRHILVIRSPLF